MNFDNRKATKNWAVVDYNRDVWIPVPLTFQGTKWGDVTNWAVYYAEDRVERSYGTLTKKLQRKEVTPRAFALAELHRGLVGTIPASKIYCHLPDASMNGTSVGIGLWQPKGAREEAFQHYAYWGSENAQEQPVAEWFDTEALGRGVKAQWCGQSSDGKPMWQVNYIFRNDEFETDVHVFTACANGERFQEMLPDLDDLVRHIRCVPDPGQ